MNSLCSGHSVLLVAVRLREIAKSSKVLVNPCCDWSAQLKGSDSLAESNGCTTVVSAIGEARVNAGKGNLDAPYVIEAS